MGARNRARVATSVIGWLPSRPPWPQPSFWYDSSDSASITSSSGAVSQWNDKSGNGRDLKQATSANQPATGSSTINSLNAITFNGTSHGLATSSFLTLSTHSWFVVVKPTGFPNSFNGPIGQENSSGTTGWGIVVTSAGKNAASANAAIQYNGTGAITLSANSVYLMDAQYDGNVFDVTVNGSLDRSTSGIGSIWNGNNALRIGFSFFASRWWKGDIAEVMGFTPQLSAQGQKDVRAYLNAKWAIY